MPIGTPKSRHSSALQRRSRMSYSIVREAFVGSVACTAPPVSCQTSQASTVPAASSPAAARFARPPSRSSHSSLVAEKYGSTTSPVRRAISVARG